MIRCSSCLAIAPDGPLSHGTGCRDAGRLVSVDPLGTSPSIEDIPAHLAGQRELRLVRVKATPPRPAFMLEVGPMPRPTGMRILRGDR